MRRLMVSLALSGLVLGATFFRTAKKVLFLLICAMLLASTASAATYYISNALGSDANTSTQAQSKATPWKHLPGMFSCSSNCASYTPQPGDKFILRGGDIWHHTDLNVAWIWSGAVSNPIYIGVDTTWFSTSAGANSVNCGASFCRPILNGDGVTISNPRDGTGNQYFSFFQNGPAYVKLDNIEFTGLYWTGVPSFNNYVYLAAQPLTVSNCYFHGWSHGPQPGTNDVLQIIYGAQGGGSTVEYNVFDGSDTDTISGEAIYGTFTNVRYNYVRNMSNGFVAGWASAHDNVVENIHLSFDPADHTNGIENLGGPMIAYNNIIRHIQGVSFFGCPAGGGTDYYYNNLLYDTDTSNVFNVDANCTGATTAHAFVYNNTIQCGPAGTASAECVNVGRVGYPPLAGVTIENNHFITDNTDNPAIFNTNGTPLTVSNTVQMTNAAATAAGYTSSNLFAPPSSTSATVRTGLNLTSSCSGSLSGLCSDTTWGVGYNATTHTVIVPGRTPLPRPVSGNWDTGAYQYNSARPNPPTGLAAVVN